MNKVFRAVSLLLTTVFLSADLHAQTEAELSVEGNAGTGDFVPFWFRSNLSGRIPASPNSITTYGRVSGMVFNDSARNINLTYALSGQVSFGKNVDSRIVEGSAKLKFHSFYLRAGRIIQYVGAVGDTSLSAGSFMVSGNAPGIPGIDIGTNGFIPVPFTKGLFSVNGNFYNGWMGKSEIKFGQSGDSINVPVYYHQSSAYVKLGKPTWKVDFFGGITHAVIWGSERKIFGQEYQEGFARTFLYVVTGKSFGTRNISKVGNQIGTVDGGMNIYLPKLRIKLSRQQFYEKGAIYHLANLRDALTSAGFERTDEIKAKVAVKTVLVEYFGSKNQAGEEYSPETPSGPENYYNHSIYTEGWAYQGFALGSPFLTMEPYLRDGLARRPGELFANNRVKLLHLGATGNFYSIRWRTKLSFSQNYGTFNTSDVKHYWFNGNLYERDPVDGIFGKHFQFSGLIELEKFIATNQKIGLRMAVDQGHLLYNSANVNVRYTHLFR